MGDIMISIRYADLNDSKTMALIHIVSWQYAYKGIIPNQILDNLSLEKRKMSFEHTLSNTKEENILIFKDNEAAGFICIGKCRDIDKSNSCGEIYAIYLLPKYINKGIGSILINSALNELKERQFNTVILWVLKDNVNARMFYEKNGFTFDGTEKEIIIGKSLVECRYIMRFQAGEDHEDNCNNNR